MSIRRTCRFRALASAAWIGAALVALAMPPHAVAGPITTEIVANADAFTYSGNDGDANYGATEHFTVQGSHGRMSYVRFNIAELGLRWTGIDLTSAQLAFETKDVLEVDQPVKIYGLTDENSDAWIEGDNTGSTSDPANEINWLNAPANDTSGHPKLIDADVSFLGTMTVPQVDGINHNFITQFTDPEGKLADFLNADTNQQVTFIMTSDNSRNGIKFFSKESSGYLKPTLTADTEITRQTIYTEMFEDVEGTTDDQPLSAYGWKGVDAAGLKLTDLDVNPARIVPYDNLEGQWRTFMGNNDTDAQWLTTEEFTLDQADLVDGIEDNLSISFLHSDSNLEQGEGYRVGLRVDGAWYLQDSVIQGTSDSVVEETLAFSDLDFIEWIGAPDDDESSWTIPTLGGGTALPSGQIDALGLMLVKDGSDEKFRFDAIRIEGLLVPEPSATVLLLLAGATGLLVVPGRRRK